MASQSQQGRQPQSLLSLNFNSKGDGLIPIPKMEDDSGCGFYGNNQGGNYDDSGYQVYCQLIDLVVCLVNSCWSFDRCNAKLCL